MQVLRFTLTCPHFSVEDAQKFALSGADVSTGQVAPQGSGGGRRPRLVGEEALERAEASQETLVAAAAAERVHVRHVDVRHPELRLCSVGVVGEEQRGGEERDDTNTPRT